MNSRILCTSTPPPPGRITMIFRGTVITRTDRVTDRPTNQPTSMFSDNSYPSTIKVLMVLLPDKAGPPSIHPAQSARLMGHNILPCGNHSAASLPSTPSLPHSVRADFYCFKNRLNVPTISFHHIQSMSYHHKQWTVQQLS